MEQKIGERFEYKDTTLEVVEQPIDNKVKRIYCNGCYFNTSSYCSYKGKCCFISRSDCKSVIFKEVGK